MTALEKIDFSQLSFGKIKKFKKLFSKIRAKFYTLKILNKTVHSLRSYEPSNLLFCVSKFCKGQSN